MKRTLIILGFVILPLMNLFSAEKEILVVSAENIFDFQDHIVSKNIANETFNIQANEEVLPFKLKDNISEKLFLGRTNDIKIKDFPVSPTEYMNVSLTRFNSAVDANTVVVRHTENGLIEENTTPILNFAGKIEGEIMSKVVLSYSSSGLFVFIERENGSRASMAPVLRDANGNHLLKIDELKLPENQDLKRMECLTNEILHADESNILTEKDVENHKFSDELLEVKVAIQGSNDFYQLVGSNYQSAYNYIVSVISVISKIYQDQIHSSLYINYIEIFETRLSDPYRNYDGVPSRLGRMPSVWNSISDSKANDRALAILFTSLFGQGGGQFVAGISMGVGTLCRSNAYVVFGIRGGYSYPSLNYHDDISVGAHELGHAFGSAHTHTCGSRGYNPPIDSCITRQDHPNYDGCYNIPSVPRPGTIMSYCHLVNSNRDVQLYFHDRVKARLRLGVERANCIDPIVQPFVSILNPNEGRIFESGTNIWIKWTSGRVNNVNIEFTTNSGTEWTEIFSNLNPGKDSVSWTLPDIDAEDVTIRIYDSFNPEIFDTSMNPFSIQKSFIQVTAPEGGERHPNIEPLRISKFSRFVNYIDIEFSTDGGNNWTYLAKNFTEDTFVYDVNGLEAENCLIRITDSENNDLVSQSDFFAIGNQFARIINPNGGEQICAERDYKIVFETDFIDRIFLEYSLDGGNSWSKIIPFAIRSEDQYYEWDFDKGISEQYLIRVYSNEDRENILDETDGIFSVIDCPTSVQDNDLSSRISLFPNPASKGIEIEIGKVFNSGNVKIELVGLNGKHIHSFGSYSASELNSSSMTFEIPDISSGQYFVVFERSGKRISKVLNIIQ